MFLTGCANGLVQSDPLLGWASKRPAIGFSAPVA